MEIIRGYLPTFSKINGDGDGYGDGTGDGYWLSVGQHYLPTSLQPANTVAFWKSDSDGRPANGGRAAPVKVGDIQEVTGPLKLCTQHALHATLNPLKWDGDRLWIVALHGEVEFDDDKMGALKREILAEVPR